MKLSDFNFSNWSWRNLFSLKFFSLLFNIIFTVFVIYKLSQRIPDVLEHYKMEDQNLPEFQVSLIDGSSLSSQHWTDKKIMVFWATWCGPCKIELTRLNKLIQEGKIKNPKSVVAISSYEEAELVKKEAIDRDYRFAIGLDLNGSVAQKFKIAGTPTILFADDKSKIKWITTGLSPSLEIRAEEFLNSN